MTEHQQAFVPYAGFVSDIKKTFSREYLAAQHALGVKVRHYREWDKNDLVALYDSFFGKEVFHYLARLVNEAHREEVTRLSGGHFYSFAQDDLSEIAPTGMDWRGFSKMMRAAVNEIKATSKRLPRELAALIDEDADIDSNTVVSHPDFGMRGVPVTAPEPFDAQAALAAMESRTAYTPAPRSTLGEAVSSFKNILARKAS